MHARSFSWSLALAGLAALSGVSPAFAADTSPAQQLQRWQQAAGGVGVATRGQQFYASRHGGEWSCASCHGTTPRGMGKHASTGKSIEPLAPAANPRRFTETAKVDKWFRRNCNDVLHRECTPREKADFLAYVTTIR